MPEIGASLRDARTRDHIDITEAEADTKIRGKYLRALENEEWDLLPGPTFVKSFLRTYGDYLGLDGRLLVEEFKLRYERPELQPIAPPRGRAADRRDRRATVRGRSGGPDHEPGRGRLILIATLVVALLVGLFLLGRGGGGGGGGTASTQATTPTTTRSSRTTTTAAKTTPKRTPTAVRLKIVPSGDVYACLRAGKQTLLNGTTLTAGAATKTYTARRMRLTLGNGDARIVVNGRSRGVPASANGIAYVLTPTSVNRIPVAQGPSC